MNLELLEKYKTCPRYKRAYLITKLGQNMVATKGI
jgi:hypothetical protein